MIERVRTKGFKGADIDEKVPMKTLYCGKNRTGKSSRAAAIALTLYGFIPFAASGKLPSVIFDSYARDKVMVVATTVNGVEFARKYSKSVKGTVTQALQVKGKKANAQTFAVELQKAGGPVIANVTEFMAQSQEKKVETLFDLFPLDVNLDSLDIDIDEAKEEISELDKQKKGIEGTIQRLTTSKQQVELPSGSLAETQAEIKSVDDQISDLEEEIRQAEIKDAERKATIKEKINSLIKEWGSPIESLNSVELKTAIGGLKAFEVSPDIFQEFLEPARDAKKNRLTELEQLFRIVQTREETEHKAEVETPKNETDFIIPPTINGVDWNPMNAVDSGEEPTPETEPAIIALDPAADNGEKTAYWSPELNSFVDADNPPESGTFVVKICELCGTDLSSDIEIQPVLDSSLNAAASIERILNALNATGCDVCAAAIIAKQELKKYKS